MTIAINSLSPLRHPFSHPTITHDVLLTALAWIKGLSSHCHCSGHCFVLLFIRPPALHLPPSLLPHLPQTSNLFWQSTSPHQFVFPFTLKPTFTQTPTPNLDIKTPTPQSALIYLLIFFLLDLSGYITMVLRLWHLFI